MRKLFNFLKGLLSAKRQDFLEENFNNLLEPETTTEESRRNAG